MKNKVFRDFCREANKFEHILKHYKKTGEKYIDPNFHPNKKIKETNPKISNSLTEFVRLDEIYKAPIFDPDLINPNFITQGHLRDCCYISALSRIAKKPYIIPFLFEKELPDKILGRIENSMNIECGAVIVYLHAHGRLTHSPSDKNKSPWFCLVEKAYAKLMGAYSNIIETSFPESVYSLFGYYSRDKYFKNYRASGLTDLAIMKKIIKYQSEHALMGASIHLSNYSNPMTQEEVTNKGLVCNHCYSILKVIEINELILICLRNPWGGHEWNGDYSDKSTLWTFDLKIKLKWEDKEDGTFWMNYTDFLKYFTQISISLPIQPDWCVKRFDFQFKPGDEEGKPINIFLQITDHVYPRKKHNLYLLIEKKHIYYDEANDINLKMIDYSIKYERQKECSAYSTNSNLKSLLYKVEGNDTIKITFNRTKKCDIVEDCYVLFLCKRNFKLWDDNDPQREFIVDDMKGYAISNYSGSSPYAAPPLFLQSCDGQHMLKKGSISDLNHNATCEERQRRDMQNAWREKLLKAKNEMLKELIIEKDEIQEMTNKEFMEKIRILESKEIAQLKNQNNAMKKDYEKKISEQAQTIKNITNELEKLKQQMNENKNKQEMIDNIKNENSQLKYTIRQCRTQIQLKNNEIEKISKENENLSKKKQEIENWYMRIKKDFEMASRIFDSQTENVDHLRNEFNGYELGCNSSSFFSSTSQIEDEGRDEKTVRKIMKKNIHKNQPNIMRPNLHMNTCNLNSKLSTIK
ncbi:hypothetical protein M9Y10_015474 [Tritrichomonas musculus]|uniref:Calpain catalytic domain-containing protein n=1 Tax=Tritrichomonas musculus TaxID=1915356 RepID=A0ABR2L2E0_9EUKA